MPPRFASLPRRRHAIGAIGAIATLVVTACGCAISFRELPEPEPDPVDDDCVYVSPSLGDDAKGDGTRAHPVASITHAIAVAETNMLPAVCLSGESYQEQVTVVSGISVYGGFDQSDPEHPFSRSDKVTTTVKAKDFVFDAPHLDEDTHLEHLKIVASSNGEPSATTYGIKLGGGHGQLFVRFDDITVEAGVDGTSGEDGAPLASGTAPGGNPGANGAQQNPFAGGGGPAPTCPIPGGSGGHAGGDDGDGAAGAPGAGNPGSGGSGGPVGACAIGVCGAPAHDGLGGSSGHDGKRGHGGAPLGRIDALDYTPANGSDGATGVSGTGGGGGGGGGGGSGDGFCFGIWFEGGGGGSGGCGGVGGDFGRAGKGGGGSFGVFATAGRITVSGNTIVTTKGGDGGKGGKGTGGQLGGGGAGRGVCVNDGGDGGTGGSGGDGGAGGPGGGGGGGPSACLGRASSVTATFDGNSCTTGAPGFGGQGGTNPAGGIGEMGSNGTAAANLLIP